MMTRKYEKQIGIILADGRVMISVKIKLISEKNLKYKARTDIDIRPYHPVFNQYLNTNIEFLIYEEIEKQNSSLR